MSTYKPINEYTVEEVAIWVECIGLKSGPFKDNAVDGDMLCNLTPEDLTGDLGLSGLETKKFQGKLAFTKELVSPRVGSGGGEGDDAAARLSQLEAENASLKKELKDLKGVEAALAAPAPPQYHPPPPQQQQQQRHHSPPPPQQHHHDRGPGVVGGAARGALGGAAKGAIAGAILPGMSAADGAAAGAAVGAATGGARGLRNRAGRRF